MRWKVLTPFGLRSEVAIDNERRVSVETVLPLGDAVQPSLERHCIQVDHVTIFRWVQRFTPLLAEAARPCRHGVGDRW